MSFSDRIDNKTDELGGKAKEAVGNATDDENLAQQGKNDQAKAGLRDAVDRTKDAVGDAAEKVKGAFKK
jgi:uncharacterized protein YjbJ (UPF0337 family)